MANTAPNLSAAPELKRTFADEFRAARKAYNKPIAEVARNVNASKREVEDWEAGRSVPKGLVLRRLLAHAPFRKLRWYIPQPERPDHAAPEAWAGVTDVPELPPVSIPATKVDEAKRIRTFGQALRFERELEGVSQEEVGYVIGVVGSAVGHWELDSFAPVQENYERLCELFPRLRDAPAPDSRAIAKPPGRSGQAGAPPDSKPKAVLENNPWFKGDKLDPSGALLGDPNWDPTRTHSSPPGETPPVLATDPRSFIDRVADLADAMGAPGHFEVRYARTPPDGNEPAWYVVSIHVFGYQRRLMSSMESFADAERQVVAAVIDTDLAAKTAALRAELDRLERIRGGR